MKPRTNFMRLQFTFQPLVPALAQSILGVHCTAKLAILTKNSLSLTWDFVIIRDAQLNLETDAVKETKFYCHGRA